MATNYTSESLDSLINLKPYFYAVSVSSATATQLAPPTIATSGATITGRTVTVTTSAAHQLSKGRWVTIAGADQAGINGRFVILTTPSATTFTYKIPNSDKHSNGLADSELPSGLITGTITVAIVPIAQRVIVVGGANAMRISPSTAVTDTANGMIVAASTNVHLPEAPSGSRYDMRDWYGYASTGTTTLGVIIL